MKVICVVKKGGGSGMSHMARYVSTRGRDEEREGKEVRKLFSASEDRLSATQANRFLGDGQIPNANDLLHVVISLEKEEDFTRLGCNEESRQTGFRDTTRSAMDEIADFYKADEFRWVAGIHRNTDNPHVHLLIYRDYVDRETGRILRLKAMPKEMRVSWERTQDGERIVNPGKLSQAFEMFLDQNIERVKRDEHESRLLLGRTLMAEDQIERLNKRLKDAVNFGEYYHYQFTNGQGRSRGFSEHDIHQRGWSIANQAMANVQSILTPDDRRQMREEVFTNEFRRHQELISKHRETRDRHIKGIESELEQTVTESQHLIEKASVIKNHYETAGIEAPAPILCREELAVLQDHAIEIGNTEKIRKLEAIRTILASENGLPTRTDVEVGRLRAQLFVLQSGLTAEQGSSDRFEENKHIVRWDSVGKLGVEGKNLGVNRSLAEIERMLTWEEDQAKFIGSRYIHWDDARRSEATTRVEKLNLQRELLLDQIEARRAGILERVVRKAEVVATLYEIFSKEEKRYQNEGRDLPAPLFTVQDLKELDNQASRRCDPEFHRTLAELERDLERNLHQSNNPQEMPSFARRVGRARARACLAEISLRESALSITRFTERRDQIDVIVNDDGKRAIAISRLADVEPNSALEQLFSPLMIQDNGHHEVTAAVEKYRERLLNVHNKAWESYTILIREAQEYEAQFSSQYPEKHLPPPLFTPVEVSKLELHAAKETDPSLKEKYEKLYCEALLEERDEGSKKIIIEKDADELLNPISFGGHPERNREIQFNYDYAQRSEQTREVSIER